jgi:hypothetical protein
MEQNHNTGPVRPARIPVDDFGYEILPIVNWLRMRGLPNETPMSWGEPASVRICITCDSPFVFPASKVPTGCPRCVRPIRGGA